MSALLQRIVTDGSTSSGSPLFFPHGKAQSLWPSSLKVDALLDTLDNMAVIGSLLHRLSKAPHT